jgi:nucleoside-diphosphate-sugar epimerase
VAPPGGGTTDYAVAIFYEAIRHGRYTCFPQARHAARHDVHAGRPARHRRPDGGRARAARAPQRLQLHRHALSRPEELAAEIRKHLPDFQIDYKIDPVRQAIADSWPRSMDDAAARGRVGWAPTFGLEAMVDDMLEKLRAKLAGAD